MSPEQNSFENPRNSKVARVKNKHIYSILIVLLLAALGAAGYLYYMVYTLQQNPQVAAQQEVASLVANVSKLILLPSDETPTIATVTDPAKLKDQAFFKNSQAGDKVLIYTRAKKAVLYRPSTNKIIDVAPLSIGAGTTPVSAPSPVSPISSPSNATSTNP